MSEHRTYSPDALRSRVALVSGAGARGDEIGIGRATALRLAHSGAKVISLDISEAAARITAEMIEAAGGESIALQADVSDPDACRRAVGAGVDRFGRLDILVNNVGIAGAAGTACDADLEAWENGLRVNVTSMMLMAKYSIPEIRKQGGGAIVNMSSVAGLRGGHAYLNYPTAKAAVIGMTQTMAEQHGRDLIRVNCVCPGLVYTPLLADFGVTDEVRRARAEASCLGIEGTPWDIADATMFLVSDASRWITGQVLAVDAGLTSLTNLVSPIKRRRGT